MLSAFALKMTMFYDTSWVQWVLSQYNIVDAEGLVLQHQDISSHHTDQPLITHPWPPVKESIYLIVKYFTIFVPYYGRCGGGGAW